MLTRARPSPTATKAEIVDRLRALAPTIRERAAAAEAARTIPPESVQDLVQAGVARILVPERFGGYGLGLDAWVAAMREISRADASHGWCAGLMTHHPHYVAQCTEEAQQAVWANGPDTIVAASIMPNAKVTVVDSGYRISSRAPFASGVNHSDWAFVGGFIPTAGGPDWALFLLSRDQYRIEDAWFTAGMCATGSNTIVADNVFVPEARVVRAGDLREGKGPGGALHANPIYRAPLIAYAPLCFATPMLGAAQAAYEHFRDWTRTRKSATGAGMAEVAATQMRLARTAADLDAADLLLQRVIEVAQSEPPPMPDLRARSMRDCARAAELCVGAVDTLISMCGTAGFALANPIQRAWRDIHFAAMHASIGPERNFINYGRLELGLPRDPELMFY